MSKPLYRQICDAVLADIVSGRYPSGKLPTDGQLVRRFNTTRVTVAKAMQELERAGVVIRRPGAVSLVRPGRDAKGLFVSTLIAGLGDTDFFEPICAQIAQSCLACNLHLIWGANASSTPLAESDAIAEVVANFRRQGVRGVFFAPDEGKNGELQKRNLEIAQRLQEAGVSVVLIDRDIVPFPRQGSYDLVGIDNVDAGWRQTRHLIDRGCRRIIYVSRPGQLWTKSARIQGFRSALSEAGLPCGVNSIRFGQTDDHEFCRSLLRQKPDGVVCFHDSTAAKLLQNFQKMRVPVPDRIKVIGLDDLKYADWLGLTTLRQPCKSIGEEAANLMALRLNNDTHPPRRILFSTELVVRETA